MALLSQVHKKGIIPTRKEVTVIERKNVSFNKFGASGKRKSFKQENQ